MKREEAPTVTPPTAGALDEDLELVEQARAGDVGAFETLVRRYQGWVFTLAFRMLGDRTEAEDMAQEIFLKAYRGLAGFRGTSRFSTWLYAITSHHCLNHLQARRRDPSRSHRTETNPGTTAGQVQTAADRLTDPSPRADALLERTDLARIVQTELSHLREEHRLILILRDIQGLSYEQIAETLGLELGTVRSRLHRARMEMKARLGPYL